MATLKTHEPANLSQVATADLRAMLRISLAEVVTSIAKMAAVWKELERRGEDLSDLRDGIGCYLERVAHGKLAAEAVGKFAGSPSRLNKLSTLPLDEQRKVASGEQPAPWEVKPTSLPATASSPTARKPFSPPAVSNPKATPQMEAAASLASPRDLAESILRQVGCAADPKDVARRLIPELQRIIERKGMFSPISLD